jgi:hypothetical protein
MFLPIHAALVGGLILVAQPVPSFDVSPSCRAAARPGAAVGAPADLRATCRSTEQQTREEIVKQWAEVSAADRAKCVPLSTLGGTPTYTELLTCIELTRTARRLRQEQPAVPLPQAVKPAPTTTGQDRS